MSTLASYPFLQAALEDAELVARISSFQVGSPRHAVILMHDVIEFILYEVLLLLDHDIYANGQHTIGLDSALSECRNLGIEVPLIGTIRAIQKHRGDAKHHAQSPHDEAFNRMLGEFRVIVSRLVHEQFGEALGAHLYDLQMLPYHTALYESYRKYRTHNWKNALRFSLSALLFKNRTMASSTSPFSPCSLASSDALLTMLSQEISASQYESAPTQVVRQVRALPDHLSTFLQCGRISEAAEIAGKAYSLIDALIPSIFDITIAKQLTPHLVIPKEFRFGKNMAWSQWQIGDTAEKAEVDRRLQTLLKNNPDFVKAMGTPYYAADDDRYWRWWELAVFDDERWHSFHLSDYFNLSLESGSISDDESKQRQYIAERIFIEFSAAVASFYTNNSSTSTTEIKQ